MLSSGGFDGESVNDFAIRINNIDRVGIGKYNMDEVSKKRLTLIASVILFCGKKRKNSIKLTILWYNTNTKLTILW